MDIWEWTRKKREEIKGTLTEKGVKDAKIAELTENIETLMFEAYQIGKQTKNEGA